MFPEVLTEGYRSFLGERLPRERERFETLAKKGQSPEVLLIGCCDSRVAPEVIFDVGPGEIFTIRNVANIVPPYESDGGYHGTSSALEFAVQALKVKHIVVLGHASCGGIKAYADSASPLSPGNFIGKWVSLVEPASNKLAATGDSVEKEGYLTRLEYASIKQSLENLMTFGFVKEAVEQGALSLHGAHFGVATGELRILDPKTGDFQSVVERDGRSLKPSALINCGDA
ncbi:carbonic anhydrase [Methylobacterium organophilum]|uniref:Carbonic anhydrase n=1 Tax=Methylobacterium organophilum TaxID=410 RepID=A0ABQ4TH42_METOR|nr:carbonic anhydrase [Methylobacterium organophilum]UMY17513.1 carbonic anhydrase [Methylobacterium organophilum]GJE29672.1 Carbonic anhydrase 1 [Methylobacterium organophilum]